MAKMNNYKNAQVIKYFPKGEIHMTSQDWKGVQYYYPRRKWKPKLQQDSIFPQLQWLLYNK